MELDFLTGTADEAGHRLLERLAGGEIDSLRSPQLHDVEMKLVMFEMDIERVVQAAKEQLAGVMSAGTINRYDSAVRKVLAHGGIHV